MTDRYIIGIDEAGRGPIAGPVAVGAVAIPESFDLSFFDGIRDSKLMPQHKREAWYDKLCQAREEHVLSFAVSFSTSRQIDERGIVFAINAAIDRVLRRLSVPPEDVHIKLDGSLRAPKRFISQETIVKGDVTEPVISLASVAAKVSRDAKMISLSGRYPAYGFEQHKGYGTKAHYAQIKEAGLSPIHRQTFCKTC